MGICNKCCEQNQPVSLDNSEKLQKTLRIKTGPQLNGISFTLTNQSMSQIKADCLVLYADQGRQLYGDQFMSKVSKRTRRKILEYLDLAEQSIKRNSIKHAFISINIPNLSFKYLIFVKIQPWNGHSQQQIQKKVYDLTIGYLEMLKLKKIKTFVIAQFDPSSGIHYSISCYPIIKAIEKYSSYLKNVVMLCESVESMKYYHTYIKGFREEETMDCIRRKSGSFSSRKHVKSDEDKLFF